MKAMHTKGPWEVRNVEEGHEILMGEAIKSPGRYQSQHKIEYHHEIDNMDGKQYAEAEANAALIIAAPELLEACRAFEKWFDGWCSNATCCAKSGIKVHDQVVAALKKAGAV